MMWPCNTQTHIISSSVTVFECEHVGDDLIVALIQDVVSAVIMKH